MSSSVLRDLLIKIVLVTVFSFRIKILQIFVLRKKYILSIGYESQLFILFRLSGTLTAWVVL